jgi:hypothetical protein
LRWLKTLIIVVLLVATLGGTAMANKLEPVIGDAATYTPVHWKDWPAYDYDVRDWLQANNLMKGYPDGNFKPWEPVTEYQVAVVAQRAGIRKDVGEYEFYGIPAKMGWVEKYFLPGTVHSAAPDEICTRYRFAKMLFRYGLNPGPTNIIVPTQSDVAMKLDKWFEQTIINGFQSRLVGTGYIFVEDSKRYNVPIWLALGQSWAESQFYTTGLSRRYNMGWGLKDSTGKWGAVRSHVSGYTDYVSVEESIHAYFRLMNGGYRGYIDSGNIQGLINRYAPSYENDVNAYYRTVMKVKEWCEDRGIK